METKKKKKENRGKTNVLQGSCYHGTAFTHAVDDRSSNRTEPRCTSSPSSAYFSLRQQQTHGDGCCSRTTFHTHTHKFLLFKEFFHVFFFLAVFEVVALLSITGGGSRWRSSHEETFRHLDGQLSPHRLDAVHDLALVAQQDDAQSR